MQRVAFHLLKARSLVLAVMSCSIAHKLLKVRELARLSIRSQFLQLSLISSDLLSTVSNLQLHSVKFALEFTKLILEAKHCATNVLLTRQSWR